tara:strand:+ start:724 stop:984 length:261 start_codon:yes stop_codon:yes gene_type:complete
MIKELKYFFFIITIFFFVFFTFRFYISDVNIKKTYRSIDLVDEKLNDNLNSLDFLESDTNDIIEYLDLNLNRKKKKYFFWKLIDND